jgi:hypothetical protein
MQLFSPSGNPPATTTEPAAEPEVALERAAALRFRGYAPRGGAAPEAGR